MKFSTLICEAAKQLFDEDALIGVRLSPVMLTHEEARELVSIASDAIGDHVHVAVGVPDGQLAEGERWCVAPGERAAERATFWRNTIHPERGERILYVSVDRLGKAGGLRDTLYELSERDLRETFFSVMTTDGHETADVMLGLQQAGIEEHADARALCDFAGAVLNAPPDERWRAAGDELPRLELVRDTSLGEDPIRRLRANARWVRAEAASERKSRTLTKRAKRARQQIKRAVSQEGAVEAHLAQIDLGTLEGADLDSDVTTKKRKRRTTGRTGARAHGGTPGGASATKTARGVGLSTPQVTDEGETPYSGEVPRPAHDGAWSAADQERELGGRTSPPPGLTKLLRELDGARGAPISQFVRTGSPRELLERPPRSKQPVSVLELAAELSPVASEVEAWERSRAALSAQLQIVVGGRGDATVNLMNAPLLVLDDPSLRRAAGEHVEVSAALLQAAARTGDLRLVTTALNLETITLYEVDEPTSAPRAALAVLGPLHPLWLGQALAWYRELEAARSSGPLGRRLIARALAFGPLAPNEWRTASHGLELESSAGVGGMLVFETVATAVSMTARTVAGEKLLRALVQHQPHARLAARIAIHGPNPGPVVEGIANAVMALAEDGVGWGAAEVVVGEALTVAKRAEEAVTAGALRLCPMPAQRGRAGDVEPHIEIVLEPNLEADEAPVEPGPLALSPAACLSRTVFSLTSRGLVAATPVVGVRGPEQVEAALSVAMGRKPSGVFHRERPLASLADVFSTRPSSPTTWQVALAGRCSRRPRAGAHVVAQERLDGAELAVMTQDLGAAARALAPVFSRLGVQDRRQRVLVQVVEKLSMLTGEGLIALDGSAEAVVGALLVNAALRHQAPVDSVVARLKGELRTTMVGVESPADTAGTYAISARPEAGGIAVWIGYCSVVDTPDVCVVGESLSGVLAGRLGGLVELFELAQREGSPAAHAAREAISWALWEAAAASGGAPDGFASAIEEVGEFPLRVEGVRLLLPGGHEATLARGGVRLRGVPVAVEAVELPLLERLIRGA